jgi:hypothetical protein
MEDRDMTSRGNYWDAITLAQTIGAYFGHLASDGRWYVGTVRELLELGISRRNILR